MVFPLNTLCIKQGPVLIFFLLSINTLCVKRWEIRNSTNQMQKAHTTSLKSRGQWKGNWRIRNYDKRSCWIATKYIKALATRQQATHPKNATRRWFQKIITQQKSNFLLESPIKNFMTWSRFLLKLKCTIPTKASNNTNPSRQTSKIEFEKSQIKAKLGW